MGVRADLVRIQEMLALARKHDGRISWPDQYVTDIERMGAEIAAMQAELRAAVAETIQLRARSATGDLAVPGDLRWRLLDPDQFEFDRYAEGTPGLKINLFGHGGAIRGAMRYPSGREGVVVSLGKTDDLFTIPIEWFNALKRSGNGPSTGALVEGG